MPTVNANKHTAHDLQLAGQMRREDYKTIKHMDKATLAASPQPRVETRV
ncbi:MAG: hypothetical protein ACLRR6_13130 [Oscillospiraceae bacterium]